MSKPGGPAGGVRGGGGDDGGDGGDGGTAGDGRFGGAAGGRCGAGGGRSDAHQRCRSRTEVTGDAESIWIVSRPWSFSYGYSPAAGIEPHGC